jgi:hypothetical protein
MSDFLRTVTDAFSSLISRGQLTVESSRYDAQAFGNALVVLVGGNLRIRIIRDRDESFADAASRWEPEDWSPLQRMIRAAAVASAPPEGLLSPAQAASLVDHHFPALDRALAADELERTKARLADLEQQALRRMKARMLDER